MDIYTKVKENVILKENITCNQKCIFDGDGKVYVGNNVIFGYHLSPHFYGFYELVQARTAYSKIIIGDSTILSNDVAIISNNQIELGENCLIGDRVTIYDHDGHEINPLTRRASSGKSSPVKIGKNVWIGSMVTILKGVTIGDNSIIGCNSVVTCSIPENSIAVGNPAKVIKSLSYLEDNYEFDDLRSTVKSNIQRLINKGYLEDACKLIDKYESEIDDDIEIISMKIVILILQGNYIDAADLAERGLELDRRNFDLLYNRAYLYELQGINEKAENYYLESLKYCEDEQLKSEINKTILRLHE